MRKKQKEMIMGIIDTILGVHETIKELLDVDNITEVVSLMGSCQDGIMSVGQLIADTVSEDEPVIDDIVNYNDLLFDISEEISESNKIDCADICNKINEYVDVIKSKIENDIKVKYEIVFLPYKTSMWDSLESCG